MKRGALRSFWRKYFPLLKSDVQAFFAYNGAFFLYAFGSLFRAFIMLFFWKAVYDQNPGSMIAGFTLNDMIVYIFISDIIGRSVYNGIDEEIAMEVKDGMIAINLVRPISYQWRMFFVATGHFAADFLFIALPIWIGFGIISYFTLGITLPSAGHFLLFIASFGLSFILMFFFNLCFGFLAFVTTNIWGLANVKWNIINLFSGRVIPLAFFPLWAQKVFDYLPFSSMNYSTAMIYLEKTDTHAALLSIAMQLFWIAIFAALSAVIWRLSIRRLSILGG